MGENITIEVESSQEAENGIGKLTITKEDGFRRVINAVIFSSSQAKILMEAADSSANVVGVF
ncbi:MAG: hypothetical protein MJ002_08980 [Paludibacteraceae bacterium]|nr:hypothetical protein [Paludibacteraceae bacterium]